jgi:hypothetical protein
MGTAAIVTGIFNAWIAGKLITRIPGDFSPESRVQSGMAVHETKGE